VAIACKRDDGLDQSQLQKQRPHLAAGALRSVKPGLQARMTLIL